MASVIHDLLPCPFCGSAADFTGAGCFYVKCSNIDCHAEAGAARTDKQAAAKWNTRALEKATEKAAQEISQESLRKISEQFNKEVNEFQESLLPQVTFPPEPERQKIAAKEFLTEQFS